MKMILLGTLLIIAGGIPLFLGIDKSVRATNGAPSPEFHLDIHTWIATWMPTLADSRPENCLNNIPYLVALGCILLGGYIIAKVI